MSEQGSDLDYEALMQVVRRRRSVRAFEKGRQVGRDVLEKIVDCGRWAPSGANSQPWDFIVVDDPQMKEQVFEVFMRQSQRLIDHAKGFPAVKKTYMANTVAIVVVVGDPRWKACFPQGTSPEFVEEYAANNEKIHLVSLGAAIQNLQLGVTAMGLTSAWLSGGGEATTNRELSELLGYPAFMEAVGTIPIGYPQKDVSLPLPPAARAGDALEPLPAGEVPHPGADRLLHRPPAPLRHVPRQRAHGGLGGRSTRSSARGRTPSPRRRRILRASWNRSQARRGCL
jgi:nitroreductase